MWSGIAHSVCTGTFINPISDVCWRCMFPMKVGSVSYGDAESTGSADEAATPVCACVSGTSVVIGLSVSFWEHARLIETVKDPYCFPTLGTGMTNPQQGLLAGEGKGMGAGGDTEQSFQQVHYYTFPVWQLLQLFMDFPCVDQGGFDLAYMTEVDAMWNDDSLAFLINPEALLFANPVTQLSCITDSVSSSMGYPLDPLFWCFGSWGSPYPLSGSVADSNSLSVNANLASRMIFKLGRETALWDTAIDQCASGVISPIMIKSHYRLQIARPVRGSQCIAIGQASSLWGSLKNPPRGAGSNSPDNFLWVLARKRKCCVGYNFL
ncbi:MAG: conjugal transfer protein TraU [Deltaproteobacteria bacterium]|nr:conjugal transfer protein TraU [Deltaproteobacteria bacterium]TLN02338.1 MAG: conjugal transfer protein TraU [bacterium]